MSLSAYAIAIGVEERRYPWREAIMSALEAADEFCLGYDKRFDSADILLIDPRIRLIELEFRFAEWDFINSALTQTRRECKGEWCLLTEMDAILQESEPGNIALAIDKAASDAHEAVNVRWFSCIQNLVDQEKFAVGPFRQSVTVNEPWLYHKTSDYMIGRMDSPIWGGNFINNYGFDDFSYYDEREGGRFYTEKAWFVEAGYSEDIGDALANYTHIWHYGFYNPGRKNAQGRQTKLWQDRVYGRSADFDIERQIELLNERVVIDPGETRQALDYFSKNGFQPTSILHPKIVQEWVDGMGLDAI